MIYEIFMLGDIKWIFYFCLEYFGKYKVNFVFVLKMILWFLRQNDLLKLSFFCDFDFEFFDQNKLENRMCVLSNNNFYVILYC